LKKDKKQKKEKRKRNLNKNQVMKKKMGNLSSSSFDAKLNTINNDTLQRHFHDETDMTLLTTMECSECFIANTATIADEEQKMNALIKQGEFDELIVVYGKNYSDENVFRKYEQLVNFGFSNVRVYRGGMYEWLLLHCIHGNNMYPVDNPRGTDVKKLVNKYRPK
jgi:hypothetical protein